MCTPERGIKPTAKRKINKKIISLSFIFCTEGRSEETCLVKEPFHDVPNSAQLFANPPALRQQNPQIPLFTYILKKVTQNYITVH